MTVLGHLKRVYDIHAELPETRAGYWNSTDRSWLFVRERPKEGGPLRWRIYNDYDHPGDGSNLPGLLRRTHFIQMTGLSSARFNTRREAVAALALALSEWKGSL